MYIYIIINKVVTNILLATSFHMSLGTTLVQITGSGTVRSRDIAKSPPESVCQLTSIQV